MNQLDIFTIYQKVPPTVTNDGTRISGHLVRPDGTIKSKPTQTEILYRYLKAGGRIADHESFNILGFPNLRSRVCNVEKQFGVKVLRERPEGKRYNVYYL